MPESVDAYTHRIGRTGRIDQKGDALTFVTAADADLVKEIEEVIKTPLERRKLQGFDYDAPAPEVSEEEVSVAPGGFRAPAQRTGTAHAGVNPLFLAPAHDAVEHNIQDGRVNVSHRHAVRQHQRALGNVESRL